MQTNTWGYEKNHLDSDFQKIKKKKNKRKLIKLENKWKKKIFISEVKINYKVAKGKETQENLIRCIEKGRKNN